MAEPCKQQCFVAQPTSFCNFDGGDTREDGGGGGGGIVTEVREGVLLDYLIIIAFCRRNERWMVGVAYSVTCCCIVRAFC